ncbi:5-oxoprolinase subunit PxpB [Nocardioides sp. Soil796]|uniref:5-oxoprolinase subunit PxpB n=1 Tax=Nocardioides sp. Soil796 TaxID=1736412 RepID=UPI00070990ED|nr:5-oxoprolinase subunit PxpB [Nocardioides sp. Soil796]KRF11943.1 allophanate hydrolase [Nocardioides sp. Soil796]
MKLLPCADQGVLVELADLDEVLALYAELVDAPPEGVVDLVPAARTLLLRIDPQRTDLRRVARAVLAADPRSGTRPDAGHVEVPVTYDGEDLAEVARLTGLGERGVIEAHTSQEWTVAFCGFAPGFGYLVGTDDRLEVPRRSTPRTKVPAGAVALAGEFTGVYPRESPGGWQLIGHTPVQAWDLDRDPPALLSPGIRVRFVEA